jgi:outer membrane protein TolC
VSFSGQYLRNIKLPVMFIPPNSAFNPTSETQTFELGSKNSYSATVTVGQTLYNQKVNTAIKIADEYASYSQTALKASRQQIILTVKKAFLNVLLMQELLLVSRQTYELADANYTNVSALYKQGVASEYDNIRAEVQRANVLPILTQTENNLALSKNYLRTVLALDPAVTLNVKGSFSFEELPAATMEAYNSSALSNSPLVTQLKINESLLDKNLIIEKSEYYPTLSAFGQYQWQTQDNTFSVSNYRWAESFAVGLQLSYNIFDGFKRGARIEQVKIDKDKVMFGRKNPGFIFPCSHRSGMQRERAKCFTECERCRYHRGHNCSGSKG